MCAGLYLWTVQTVPGELTDYFTVKNIEIVELIIKERPAIYWRHGLWKVWQNLLQAGSEAAC